MPVPPNGAVRSRTRNAFTQTVPARTLRPTRSARSAEVVQTTAESPYGVEFATFDGFVLVLEVLQCQDGPEDLALDDLRVV